MAKELITAETSLNGTKTRKSPVPQDGNRIKEGALKLPLAERVALRNVLTISIDNELKSMEENFNQAKKLIEG